MQSSPEVAGIREGEVLAGKYRVEQVLGAGAMGVVVAAHHLQLDAKVAIKFLMASMLENEEAVARFTREARAAARIANEHIARVLDFGTLDSGAPFIVMEFLDGVDLSALLRARGPLPVEQAVEFVLQACEALAEAHGLGIIHRDLKPANLFCVRRSDALPFLKVLDFGISKTTSLGASAHAMTMTGTTALMGSPLYMSPEQMESSRAVDARSDIWALGVVLHEVLTGESPFVGNSLPEVCMKIATRPPPALRRFRPDAPAQLEVTILKCLEKDRTRRYANVAELALDLAPFAPERARMSVERTCRTVHGAGATTERAPAVRRTDATTPSPATATATQSIVASAVTMPRLSNIIASGLARVGWRAIVFGALALAVVVASVLSATTSRSIPLRMLEAHSNEREPPVGGSSTLPQILVAHSNEQEPIVCDGNDKIEVTDVRVSHSSGAAMTASGNCHVNCTRCILVAPVAVSVNGNAQVDLVDSSAEATESRSIDVHGNGHVRCTRCTLKARVAISAESNAEVVLVDSNIEGAESSIVARNNANVRVLGNSTVVGPVARSQNARVIAPPKK
jgi:serine/threonine protein kinase